MTFTGRILVATPVIADPNFERTVVLILAHGDEGALGVVLNRPSLTRVAEVVEEWAPFAAAPEMMFIGGPVGQNAVVGLAMGTSAGMSIQPIVGPLGTIDLNEPPSSDDGSGVTVRLFAGSGTTPGVGVPTVLISGKLAAERITASGGVARPGHSEIGVDHA